MATPNYGFEKRQKELAKKRKKEEKLKAKAERKLLGPESDTVADDSTGVPDESGTPQPPATDGTGSPV